MLGFRNGQVVLQDVSGGETYAVVYVLIFFFFFQAEDGIRDKLVTGVQTCALPISVLLGLLAAGIGFNIQHDGGHQAYSNHPWVNKLMAMTLELIGGSSHLWRWKHVVLHHTYVNITGHDTDIDLGLLARLTPHQRRLPYHRWQHLYLWPLYGLLAIKWQLLDDFRKLISGRISNQPFPGPKGRELVIFIAAKAIFFTMAFGIPLLFHSIGVVLLYYGVAGLVAGVALGVVFQGAHCVEEAAFPLPREQTGGVVPARVIQQASCTVGFARRSGAGGRDALGRGRADLPRAKPENFNVSHQIAAGVSFDLHSKHFPRAAREFRSLLVLLPGPFR